jgi:HAE1 family hydrophobic/amphiphilic exporter-1
VIRWLAKLSVGRPVTVVSGFVALLVLGILAWDRVPLEMMPGRFTLNKMWVWMPYKDSTPQENLRQLVRPVEDHLATTPGIKRLKTRSGGNYARAELEFHRSISMDAAYNAVVDRMDRAMADMPDDLDRYYVYRWNPSDDAIYWGGISTPDSIDDPHHVISEVVVKHMERVPGVGKVETWGIHPRRVFIDFNLDLLFTHRMGLMEVVGVLGSDNFQLASGRLVDDGRVRYVRSLARYQSLDDLKQTPIRNGLTLSDIADVQYRPDPSAFIGSLQGKEGAGIAIYKESEANTVEVARAIEAAFDELRVDTRVEGMEFVSFFSQGQVIQGSLDNLKSTALWGGLFAIIVLFSFLRKWRMTLLIAACIPFTLLITVTVTYFAGRSLNLLSLMGLMLAVGMVVDNSIVVTEAIQARRERGAEPKDAAVKGANDVGLAIVLSTMTTMVVFLPIILMSDDANFSFFMSELGMPVVWALAASLVVALVFTPLTTTLLKPGSTIGSPAWVVWTEQRYQRALGWVLSHRTDALVGLLGLTVLTAVLPFKAVGCSDDSDGNMGEFIIRYQIPSSYSYSDRKKLVETVDAYVQANVEAWGVRTFSSRMRGSSSRGRTYVYLSQDRADDAPSREEVIEMARDTLPELPGVRMGIGWGGGNGPPTNTISLLLEGDDTRVLEELGNEVERVVEGVPGVLGAQSEMEEEGGREVRLAINRQASARYNIRPAQVGQQVSLALRGNQLPDFIDGDKEVDVFARFRLEDRKDLDRLLDWPMWSQEAGTVVPLRTLTDSSFSQGLGTIHRDNRVTSYPIQIDLKEGVDKDQTYAQISAALANLSMPRGYSWSRNKQGQAENNEARIMALLLSITFVFLLMGVLFESFLLPLSIITTIPMAFLGVYWTLWLTGTPLDAMGAVGMVVLVGVVVNNGIVYIDLVTRLRRDGISRTQALIEAGGRRLRPILMTALTTIFGVLPMAMGDSNFVGMPYSPLGRVVAGGLAAGTLLTLFLLPFLYSVLDDARDTSRRWLAWVVGRSPVEASK